ncbi:MAG TPA: hypothetical protein DEW39_10705 [Brevibacterium sp.]|nr:hypothetical protein [Brevibacterium sp.]
MSLSTSSQLEPGQRKPRLESLLPLANIHAPPLDELFRTPSVGDPRIHITPQEINGQAVLPLSRGAIGVQALRRSSAQAFRHIADGRQTPKLGVLKTHPGFERVCVIRADSAGFRATNRWP